MGKIYCSHCGAELDDSYVFCSNCGVAIESDDITETNENNPLKNLINTILNNPKIMIGIGIAIILIVAIGIVSFWNGGDLVDVTKLEMSVSYSDTPFGSAVESANIDKQEYAQRLQYLQQNNPEQYKVELQLSGMTEDEWPKYLNTGSTNHQDYQVGKAIIKFSLMPKETITRVTGLKVTNIEVSFDNGEKENWGTCTYEPNSYYDKDTNYDFSISKVLEGNGKTVEDYYKITHIKADIVMDTTDNTNVVIGHINSDVTPSHY